MLVTSTASCALTCPMQATKALCTVAGETNWATRFAHDGSTVLDAIIF